MAQEAEKQGDARQNNPLNNQCTLFSDFNLSKRKKLKSVIAFPAIVISVYKYIMSPRSCKNRLFSKRL